MCEIRLTKLSRAAQQVGIVHFYAVTEIKGLSCRLRWMREWRNLLTSTHVGYRLVIRAVASGASLKFGIQGASATNWFSRVNGARDNGIRLYIYFFFIMHDIYIFYIYIYAGLYICHRPMPRASKTTSQASGFVQSFLLYFISRLKKCTILEMGQVNILGYVKSRYMLHAFKWNL